MSLFEEVVIVWNDKEYKVPSDRVWGLCETVEDIVTFGDLDISNLKRYKLARAYAAALRYAGAAVSDEEVLDTFFNEKAILDAAAAIFAIQKVLIPPSHVRRYLENVGDGENGAEEGGKKSDD